MYYIVFVVHHILTIENFCAIIFITNNTKELYSKGASIMDKQLKPKSFRITDETAEKFREISSELGGNQQETLAKLIEAFEFQNSKLLLPEQKNDIEKFEKYTSILIRMFMNSLEDNQNITDFVRTQFEAQLLAKEKTIYEFQEKSKIALEEKEEITKKCMILEKEKADLQKKNEQLQIIISDKEVLTASLLETIASQKELLNIEKS